MGQTFWIDFFSAAAKFVLSRLRRIVLYNRRMLENFWDGVSRHVISPRRVRRNEKLFPPIYLVKESEGGR